MGIGTGGSWPDWKTLRNMNVGAPVNDLDSLCQSVIRDWTCHTLDGCDVLGTFEMIPVLELVMCVDQKNCVDRCNELNAGDECAINHCRIEVNFVWEVIVRGEQVQKTFGDG